MCSGDIVPATIRHHLAEVTIAAGLSPDARVVMVNVFMEEIVVQGGTVLIHLECAMLALVHVAIVVVTAGQTTEVTVMPILIYLRNFVEGIRCTGTLLRSPTRSRAVVVQLNACITLVEKGLGVRMGRFVMGVIAGIAATKYGFRAIARKPYCMCGVLKDVTSSTGFLSKIVYFVLPGEDGLTTGLYLPWGR